MATAHRGASRTVTALPRDHGSAADTGHRRSTCDLEFRPYGVSTRGRRDRPAHPPRPPARRRSPVVPATADVATAATGAGERQSRAVGRDRAPPAGCRAARPDPAGGVHGAGSGSPESHDRWLPSETNPDPTVDIEGVFIGAPATVRPAVPLRGPRPCRLRPVPAGRRAARPDLGGLRRRRVRRAGPRRDDGARARARCRLDRVQPRHPARRGAEQSAGPGAAGGLPGDVALPGAGHPAVPAGVGASTCRWSSAVDPRFEQFVLAMLRNPFLTPEANATCSNPRRSTSPIRLPSSPARPARTPSRWTSRRRPDRRTDRAHHR